MSGISCLRRLRLVGDMISNPVMRAIRRGAFKFRGPVWSEESRKALVVVYERMSDAVAVAIRKGSLRVAETLDWSPGLAAIETAFALHRRLHLFRAAPSVTMPT